MLLKVGENGCIQLPADILKELRIVEGSAIEISVHNDELHQKIDCRIFSTDSHFQVQCFGQFAIYHNSVCIPIKCAKAKELLALLVLENGGPLSKRHIISLLWPESSYAHGRDCLYKTLHWIKQHPEINSMFNLDIRRCSLSAQMENLQIDLVEFDYYYSLRSDIHCCEKAIDFYQGPLLWKDYYDWSDEGQSKYEIRYSTLVGNIADYYSESTIKKQA